MFDVIVLDCMLPNSLRDNLFKVIHILWSTPCLCLFFYDSDCIFFLHIKQDDFMVGEQVIAVKQKKELELAWFHGNLRNSVNNRNNKNNKDFVHSLFTFEKMEIQ